MNHSDYRIAKVVTFFKSIDEDLKNSILDSFLFANREEKRMFSKIKDNNEKISKMLYNPATRKKFSDVAYLSIKENIPFDFDVTYEDILSSFSNDNCIFYAIFFFRWCYEYGEDGICNDDKYFIKFVDSELFDNIINHIPLKKSDNETLNIQENNLDNNSNKSNIKVTNERINNEVTTMKLLGRIEKRNTYYNFFPQYKLIDEKFIEISNEELKSEYPTSGGINLSYTYSGKSYDFLENEIKSDLDKDLFVETIYLVEIDNFNLEENNNDVYRVKLDLEKISHNHSLSDIIKGSNNVGIYKVVTSESAFISQTELASRLIFIKEDNIIEGEPVVLLYENKYYGPFIANLRSKDGKFYIKTGAYDNNYFIPYYTNESVEELEFEKQAHFEDPHYTYFIHVIGSPENEDLVTDEILLKNISDDISVNLAITNPEEFARMCKNSPFFTDNKIANDRIHRLEEIIANADAFREEKRKIFDDLSKLYQGQSSETSDKTVIDSDLYKELQSKYNEERNKNSDNEIKLQKLIKENSELNAQINDLRTSKPDVISVEQISKYESEIAELSDKLEKAEAINVAVKSIEELKIEQQKLENNNDYLKGKADEYEANVKIAQDKVCNAIQTGVESTANAAFEPFISSAMLKAAANWDNKTEAENYIKCKEKLNSLTASSLSGDDLIAYIVRYVQERRDYSYNDIINIYVNIVQNFITIFSGEPGTGKTSICNIIAETLGLLNFGPDINRFVSVSVERGWSSKRDFIGYFNPLTKKYDKSNSKVYDALMKLDAENNESKYPFFIMLDEANLSPIEHYWADFMRLTDRSSSNDSYINIGIDKELYIPETLRFVATINTDQTTESLSPRLIDRACIIKLPKVDKIYSIDSVDSLPNELISWSNFYQAFSSETDLSSATLKILKEIYALFNSSGMNVSPRIQIGIERYIKSAQNIMIESDGAITSEIAIDYAVIQKLLPKINGPYSTYQRFFEAMKQLCKEHNLKMTNDVVDKMISDQESNMGYCQYLI